MQFLTLSERIQLQQILMDNTLLQTADVDFRLALLTTCGLDKHCKNISFIATIDKFVISLCTNLSYVYILEGASEKLGLIVFLEYIYQIDGNLSSDDKEFFEHVFEKWKQWQISSRQKQRQITVSRLAQIREEQPPIPRQQMRVKIDKDVIISYDLESQMAIFRQHLGYEGAFAFTIGGDMIILEHYIFERMMRELKSKTGRPYITFAIHLNQYDDLSPGISLIERKLAASYTCDTLPRWFDDNPKVDVVLIVWNHDILPVIMKAIASSFWNAVTAQVLSRLKDQSRCFVVIWANIGTRKCLIDQSTILLTPMRFEIAELEQWFRGQLKQLEIGENIIEQYLLRLKSQHGHLMGTYQEMQGIIHELQGGVILYE